MRRFAAFLTGVGGLALAAGADPPLQSPNPPLSRPAPCVGLSRSTTITSDVSIGVSISRHAFVHRLSAGRLHFLHGTACPLCLHQIIGAHPFHGRFPHQGWWWWGGHGGFGALGTYNGPYLVGVDSPISAYAPRRSPAADGADVAVASAPAEPTPCDPAADPRCALLRGRYGQALRLLGAAADSVAMDADDRRLAALALLGLGRFDDAVSAMAQAYSDDPSLARAPLDLAALLGDAEDRLFSLAVRRAHRSASPDAWLLVAVFMQGEGRDDAAWRMLAQPEGAGIDAAIVQAFAQALGARRR